MARESITTGATGGNKRRASTHYGRRFTDTEHPALIHLKHGEEVHTLTFEYDTLPNFGEDELIQRIGAHAVIVSATLQVVEPFVGGDAIKVGSASPDGTNLSDENFVTAVEGAVANLGAVGDYVVGGGAGIGAPLAGERQIRVTADGVFTEGKATLYVVSKPLINRADQFNDDL